MALPNIPPEPLSGALGDESSPHAGPGSDPGFTRRDLRAPQVTGDPIAMLHALWESLEDLRRTVENEHVQRLQRIEGDLRWVTLLLGAEVVALVGAAIAGVMGR